MAATTKPAPVNASQIAAQVDELGALDKELAPVRGKLKREEQLRKAIRAHFADSPAALQFEAKGEKFTAIVGPKSNESNINVAKLIKAIGVKIYSTFATVTLKALEQNVAPDIVAGVVSVAPTGSRSLTVFERSAK